MGTKFSTTYAALVLGYLEAEIYTQIEQTDEQYSEKALLG